MAIGWRMAQPIKAFDRASPVLRASQGAWTVSELPLFRRQARSLPQTSRIPSVTRTALPPMRTVSRLPLSTISVSMIALGRPIS